MPNRKPAALMFAVGCAVVAVFLFMSPDESLVEQSPEPKLDDAPSVIPTPTPHVESALDDSPQFSRVEGITLLNGSGDPLKGVAIQLRRESDGEFVEHTAKSGEDGVFRFEGLTSGGYTLVAEHESLVAERQPHSFEVAEDVKAHWIEVVMLEGGAISGRVYDASTRKGIEGARIEMKYHMGPSATTDVNGYYILTGVPAGEARVFREFVQDYMRRKDEARGILAEVTPGQTTEGVDFPLMKGVLALIQGRVLDEAGVPVAGARVRAADNKDPFNPTSNRATTDADGAFTLDGFEVSGSIFLEALSEGAASDDVGPLTLTADGIQGLEVVLRPTGSLSGHVIDLDGNPVADSSIRVGITYTRTGRSGAAGESALDENGAFTIENLSERSYGFFISPHLSRFSTGFVKPLLTVDLAAGEHLTGIELPFDYAKYLEIKPVRAAAPPPAPPRAKEPPRVEVKIRIVHSDTNEPVGRSRIRGQYRGASKNDSFDSFADTEGRFSVRPRHGDAVELLAEATGFAPGHAEFSVDENGRVSGGDIVIRLEPGAAVDGSVVDEQGAPVIGASIYINFDPTLQDDFGWDPSSDRATVTDGDGAFYLDSLGSEPTTFYVEHPSFAYGSAEVIPTRPQPSSVQIVMNSGGVIEGSVWWNGAPQRGLRLALINANDAHVDIGSIVTDADGRYRIDRLSPGEYAVQTSIMADYRWIQRRLLVVSEGSTTQVDFFSPSVPGILEGTVLLGGIIPEYMSLQLKIETDYGREWVASDGWIKTGNFVVENLPSGWATLSVTAIDANHERVKATEEFQISEGATLRMDFDL